MTITPIEDDLYFTGDTLNSVKANGDPCIPFIKIFRHSLLVFSVCVEYGDNFATADDTGITGCNNRELNFDTDMLCMQACLQETEFICINVEYKRSDGACYMCDTAWFNIDPSDRTENDYGWTLFHRHCSS